MKMRTVLVAAAIAALSAVSANAMETKVYYECTPSDGTPALVPFMVTSMTLTADEVKDMDPDGILGIKAKVENYLLVFLPRNTEPEPFYATRSSRTKNGWTLAFESKDIKSTPKDAPNLYARVGLYSNRAIVDVNFGEDGRYNTGGPTLRYKCEHPKVQQ